MDKHSKWPVFMRMHGSVMPKMILPLLWVAGWSTAITCISRYVHSRECSMPLGSNNKTDIYPAGLGSRNRQHLADRAGFRGGSGIVFPQFDCI